MRPELVLNEDDKKRRFQKLIRKKEEEASSKVMSSPEFQHSDDDSSYESVHKMPPLQPIESNATTSIPFTRGSHFPYIFPSTSSAFNKNVYSSKLMNSYQDLKRFELHKTKNYISPGKDFLSELR